MAAVGCLGFIPGLYGCCCGHGNSADACFGYLGGRWVSGAEAYGLLMGMRRLRGAEPPKAMGLTERSGASLRTPDGSRGRRNQASPHAPPA